MFVAKEAAYKAQYPTSRQLFDFQTLRIIWQDQGFSAAFQQAILPFEKHFQISGRVAENPDHVAAICWLPTV
jgi:4'-phosphopantetheinyl transferase EntD